MYGIARSPDQPLLGELGAKIAAVLQPLGATRPTSATMMAHPGGLLGREHVVGRGPEEPIAVVLVEGRRVRDVDDAPPRPPAASARPSPVSVLTPVFGAAASTSWPCPAERSDQLGADQAGSANDDDLHGLRYPCGFRNERKIAQTGILPPSCGTGCALPTK